MKQDFIMISGKVIECVQLKLCTNLIQKKVEDELMERIKKHPPKQDVLFLFESPKRSESKVLKINRNNRKTETRSTKKSPMMENLLSARKGWI